MLSLLFKISADSTPITRSLKGVAGTAKEAGAVAGKEFGAQFKGGVMSFIGAGAIIGAVRKLVAEAAKIDDAAMKSGRTIEATQALNRAAELTGKTVEELLKLSPELSGDFAKLMDAVNKAGGFLDAETVGQLADAADQWDRANRAFAPVVSGALKLFNVVREGGQRVFESILGAGFKLKGLLTGDKETQAGGDDMIRDAFGRPFESGRSRSRAPEKQAAADLLQAERQQEGMAKAKEDMMATLGPILGIMGGKIPADVKFGLSGAGPAALPSLAMPRLTAGPTFNNTVAPAVGSALPAKGLEDIKKAVDRLNATVEKKI